MDGVWIDLVRFLNLTLGKVRGESKGKQYLNVLCASAGEIQEIQMLLSSIVPRICLWTNKNMPGRRMIQLPKQGVAPCGRVLRRCT